MRGEPPFGRAFSGRLFCRDAGKKSELPLHQPGLRMVLLSWIAEIESRILRALPFFLLALCVTVKSNLCSNSYTRSGTIDLSDVDWLDDVT